MKHPSLRRKKPIARKTRPRRQRKTPLAALKRKLWQLFAAYVKERDGNVCFSCGATGLEGQNWHAGHLVSARKASTRYSPENVFSQCARCNLFLRGNIEEFTFRYMERFGEPKFRALIVASRDHREWKRFEVDELIAALQRGGAEYETFYWVKYGTWVVSSEFVEAK